MVNDRRFFSCSRSGEEILPCFRTIYDPLAVVEIVFDADWRPWWDWECWSTFGLVAFEGLGDLVEIPETEWVGEVELSSERIMLFSKSMVNDTCFDGWGRGWDWDTVSGPPGVSPYI